MGTIETQTDLQNEVTVNRAMGIISSDDLLDWIECYYSGDVTKFILWDFTKADLSDLSSDDIKRLVYETKKITAKRAGGKTAFVVGRDVEFGIIRMFDAYVEVEGVQIEFRTFRDSAAAKKWLGM